MFGPCLNVDQCHKLGSVLNHHIDTYLREHLSLSDVTNLEQLETSDAQQHVHLSSYEMIHPVIIYLKFCRNRNKTLQGIFVHKIL